MNLRAIRRITVIVKLWSRLASPPANTIARVFPEGFVLA
jgi:hypothetical protein